MSTLIELVKERYDLAKKCGALIYYEGDLEEKDVGGMKFEITHVPSLRKKPTSDSNAKKEFVNPFINPDPNLIVKELDNYHIMLNKFCVRPHHLLLVTKEFKQQTEPLFPEDLYFAWYIMETAFETGNAFAFYNCGPLSGASQPHKHVQFMPMFSNEDQLPIMAEFDKINNRQPGQIYTLNLLPFVHVIIPLDSEFLAANTDKDIRSEYLGQMFFGLLDEMFQKTRENASPVNISYNFVMTKDFMMLVPRSKEMISMDNGSKISVNSLGFVGMLLTKTDAEREALKQDPDILLSLTQVGFPWTANDNVSVTTSKIAAE